ncbi:phage tail protein [Pseudomonas sp. SWI6]|uniref:phage tail-collar fiber domain-containing protein n=1 Tax=Pseudomonas sp. SWI6 TaxID=2083051 RepID=UPI002114BD22|nr:phage tail protein [Pseudomonas sp. SWI6]
MARITLAGESLIAQKQGAQEALVVAKFIFANVPGLNPNDPVDRAAAKPPANQIVYTYAIPPGNSGYVNPNQVVYSAQLGSDIGDFDWNWMGLETAEGVLFAVAYMPVQQKRKNIPPLQLGNNVTRNVLVEYDGAQETTGITIDAQTWQHDFTVRLAGIDERERLSNRDIFGRACFFDSGLQVEKVGTNYQIKPGLAYVEGVRVSVPAALAVPSAAFPTTVWLDVVLERQLNDVVARWSISCAAAKPDYKDAVGVQHYCIALADLTTSAITDRRPVEAITGPLVQHFAAKVGTYAQLRAQATTKGDVGLDQIPNAISDDPSSNSSAILATTKMVQTVRGLLQTAIDNILSGASIVGKAAKLATARTISLTGGATGSGSFDGSTDLAINVTVNPASHTHTIAQTSGLQAALDAKLPLAGGTVTGATAFHQGIHGGYGGGNGGTVDWGANIWGMGPTYDGNGAGAEYTISPYHYGLSWLRASHPDATAQIGEGVYVTQNAVIKGGIGHYGIWTAGVFYGNGAGITSLNASNLSSGILPDARLSGTYTGVNITGNAATATKWATPRTVTFTGGATGSVSLDGSANVSVSLAVQPSAHTHTTAQITGLDADLLEAAPPGQVAAFARATAPAGWLKANGAAVSRTAYAQLFAAIGTQFGAGDGSSTFNLPDMRGEFIRGLADGRNLDLGRVLGSVQESQNLSHDHGASVASAGAHTHAVSGTAASAGSHTHNTKGASGTGATNAFAYQDVGSVVKATDAAGDHTHTVSGTAASAGAHTHTVTIAADGGNEARPRNVALLYCIKI